MKSISSVTNPRTKEYQDRLEPDSYMIPHRTKEDEIVFLTLKVANLESQVAELKADFEDREAELEANFESTIEELKTNYDAKIEAIVKSI